MSSSKETTAETLELLEGRLRRVSFVLNGPLRGDDQDSALPQTKGSAIVRLRSLERTLQALSTQSVTASDVIALHKKHPDLFHSQSASDIPSMLPPASLATLVLAHSHSYQTLSTQLFQLQGASIPDPASAAKLIDLRPRLESVKAKQDSQAEEMADLRLRSARALESWYEGGVLGMAERWAEWEERLRNAEILIRRREAAKKREDSAV